MSQKKEKRTTVLPVVRVSPSEKEAIRKSYLSSSFSNQSSFIRSILLGTCNLSEAELRLQKELLLTEIFSGIEDIQTKLLRIIKEKEAEQSDNFDNKSLLRYTEMFDKLKNIKEQLYQNEQL